jgi:hypothetical protein
MKMIDGYVFDLLRQTIGSTENPEVKLKSFNMLTAYMDHLQNIDPAQLQSVLLASVKWKPVRSVSVLRCSAALLRGHPSQETRNHSFQHQHHRRFFCRFGGR